MSSISQGAGEKMFHAIVNSDRCRESQVGEIGVWRSRKGPELPVRMIDSSMYCVVGASGDGVLTLDLKQENRHRVV
jgi:hypothetical protein